MTTQFGSHATPEPRNAPVAGGLTAARPILSQIHRDLRAIFSGRDAGGAALDRILQLASHHTDARFVGLYQAHRGTMVPIASTGDLKSDGRSIRPDDLARVCHICVTRDEMTTRCLSNKRETFAIAIPTLSHETTPMVLAAIVSGRSGDLTSHVLTLERIASAIVRWKMSETISQLDWESLACAGAAELVSRVAESDSILEATFQLVNQLHTFLECDQVSLGLAGSGQVGCKLQAVSGMAEFDRNSTPIRELTSAMDECLVRDKPTVWPPLNASERHATLAHRKLTGQGRHEAVFSVPLRSVNDRLVGVLLLTGRRRVLHDKKIQGSMRALAPHLATAIDLRIRSEPNMFQKAGQWVFGDQDNPQRKWLLAVVALLLFMVPCLPWPYRVTADCQVEPVLRRFSVAPYAGILKQSHVQPGDLVHKDQLLANMDDRELRWEMASTLAEASRARTKRDQAMNEHATAEAKLAQLELKRAELKVTLLRNRQRQLDILCPIDGVVLQGDLKDTEGAPVKTGQPLFEIAPLDPLRLNLFIREEDLPSVNEGSQIMARLDGYNETAIRGTITKLHPQSEIHDSQNVFVAEVEVANPRRELRPGMSGRARVSAGRRPLGWIWFHRAWNRIQRWMGI